MRRSIRVGLLAAVGVATLAAVAIHQSRGQAPRDERRGVKDLWAALDGAVGQPRRLLRANLPRLRLHFASRRPHGAA